MLINFATPQPKTRTIINLFFFLIQRWGSSGQNEPSTYKRRVALNTNGTADSTKTSNTNTNAQTNSPTSSPTTNPLLTNDAPQVNSAPVNQIEQLKNSLASTENSRR